MIIIGLVGFILELLGQLIRSLTLYNRYNRYGRDVSVISCRRRQFRGQSGVWTTGHVSELKVSPSVERRPALISKVAPAL